MPSVSSPIVSYPFKYTSSSFFQAVHAKRHIHVVADTPGQHATRIPVDHCYQIREATCEPVIRNIRAPHMVGPYDRQTAQQVRIDLVPRMIDARRGAHAMPVGPIVRIRRCARFRLTRSPCLGKKTTMRRLP